MEADAKLEARAAAEASATVSTDDGAHVAANGENGGANTFEPGEGKSAEESFATQFTAEEKARIREMVANAASAEEIDRIEGMVKRGVFPGNGDANGGSAPPPPPPPEAGDGGDAKRQRTE